MASLNGHKIGGNELAKKSKIKGLSFLYNRDGTSMHCGISAVSEYERLGKSKNPLAPRLDEKVNIVFIFGKEFPEYNGYTVEQLICELNKIDFVLKLTRE